MSINQGQAGGGMNAALMRGTHPHHPLAVWLPFPGDLGLHVVDKLSQSLEERAELGISHPTGPYHAWAPLEIEPKLFHLGREMAAYPQFSISDQFFLPSLQLPLPLPPFLPPPLCL